ncbi:MAG: uncharacterized protein JWN88_184 [Frankiales bacterium]|nr:uncharacterized protein [Frankiales bacterium]
MAKSANLLVDGLGSPGRVGLVLPPHWQTVCLLLAGVAAGAEVVVAAGPDGVADCDVAFVLAEQAADVLALGVDEVFALSGHPLGAPVTALPGMAQDFAREVPSYADAWTGQRPDEVRIRVEGEPVGKLPVLDVSGSDRVLVDVDLTTRAGLGQVLAVLRSGASLVLVPPPREGLDVAALAAAERVTATLGGAVAVPGLTALDA